LGGAVIIETRVGNEDVDIGQVAKLREAVVIDLRVVGQHDHPPTSTNHRPLDGGLRQIRRRQTATHRNAVRANKGDIAVNLGKQTQSPLVDCRQRTPAYPPANEQQGKVGSRREGHGDGRRVGKYGQRTVSGQRLCQTGRGRASIKQYGTAVGNLGQRGQRNAIFLGRHDRDTRTQPRLKAQALNRQSATVHATQQTLPFED
jgi:hypothetical protein